MNFSKNKKCSTDDVVIIGSGIAGMTCALYLGRAGVKTTITGDWAESSLASSPMVKNYPGAGEVDGATILNNLHGQMMNVCGNNIVEIQENCISLYEDEDSGIAVVETEHHIVSSTKIVIATGRRPKLLGIPGEQELIGNGISTCAYCDGNLYAGKSIAIIGGGNSAVDEAVYLSGIVDHIDLIVRKDHLRADEIQCARLMLAENVSILFNAELKSLSKIEDKISTTDNHGRVKEYDGIFYAIGSTPNTDFIHLPEFDKIKSENLYGGYVPKIFQSGTNTTIFSAGDISYKQNKKFQAILAAAEGAETAFEII